ncbi:MAG TPA: gamma-glutamyltransferase [Gemmatimonadaceae bacterium]|jgi:gamma-glutamyltranspeptidase/glutathione hydrolase|nr:gamma-glutamyltransferase [Gemmatimonadaceae bacterium]
MTSIRHQFVAVLAAASVSFAAPASILVAQTPARDTATVASKRGLVVSVSGIASDIGASVLARGGNAVDAAVATGFALAVTHPSAGNLGGGGFMIVRTTDGRATTFDYRERAPGAATPTMYLKPDGTIDRSLTRSGWLAPGVPGTVRGLALAHKRFGKLPWAEVVRPAARLASTGFPLSRALAGSLNRTVGGLMAPFPSSVAAYGKPGRGEWKDGDTLRLPDLGRALEAIAADGPDAFYTGWIADSLAAQMKANGGLITKADLAAYEPKERAPVRGTFNGYEVIAMGPPSSGGAVMLETLNILERFDVAKMDRWSPEFLHLRIEAARRAYADRARWLGDPDFVSVPMARLTSKAYADSLARTIDRNRASTSLEIGADIVTTRAAESDETTHFSVVDADGNAVANTYTLEGGYGSGVVVRGAGFILNNEMGDFNKKPGETNTTGDIGTPANLIAPGKRMLSSMSPAIVTRDGRLVLVTGSPGGRTIPNTVIDVVLGVTAFGQSARDAVSAPRVHHQWMPDATTIEPGTVSEATIAALRARGHDVRLSNGRQGDAHTIWVDTKTGVAYGAADLRTPDSKASAPR